MMKRKERKGNLMESKKRTYVVQIDNKNVRTIITDELIHLGSIIEDDNWFGTIMKGGKVTKLFK